MKAASSAGSDIGTHVSAIAIGDFSYAIAIVTLIGFELKNETNAKRENQREFCEVLRERVTDLTSEWRR